MKEWQQYRNILYFAVLSLRGALAETQAGLLKSMGLTSSQVTALNLARSRWPVVSTNTMVGLPAARLETKWQHDYAYGTYRLTQHIVTIICCAVNPLRSPFQALEILAIL